jgi:molybdopterin molybdotransferase
MLSVAEAQAVVLQHARPLPPQTVPLGPEALGRVLAETVISDLDMPPYDKAVMDGYAVRAADLPDGRGTLTVIEEVTAGHTPTRPVGPGQATRIMTGAPLPAGADAVIVVERTRMLDDQRVDIEDRPPHAGQNIQRQGGEMLEGDAVLSLGAVLRPQEFGVLTTVGRTTVCVYPPPRVAVLSTGDEVVEAPARPGPGQIRNGNGAMLVAQVARAGALPRYLGIARDRADSLGPLIADGLKENVLVLCGGVSAGKLDLVPGALAEAGVQAQFHKVTMKPGKPVFFGTRGDTLVFGLPGNPVSSLVCFELFVRPALRVLMGHADAGPRTVPLPLAADFAYRTDRPTYYPARLETGDDGLRVRPVPWSGSADLRAWTAANAVVVFPAGDHRHPAGQRFPVLMIEERG